MRNLLPITLGALVSLASFIYYYAISDISASLYTLSLAVVALGLYQFCGHNMNAKRTLAYGMLTVTPLLTLADQIGTLTGFTRSGNGLPWLGVSFASLGVAYLIFVDRLNTKELFLNILQPLPFSSGPVVNRTLRLTLPSVARSRIYLGWFVLGAFYYSVLAAGLSPLMFLKSSTDALDVFVFGLVFEIYVYLNFAGISFMVYGVLNLVGVPVAVNFKTPFASRDVMEYWQRWHLSFGAVLKAMIFGPLRKRLGLGMTVISVFMMSAMWHGVTLNFLAWGLFHGIAWVIAYLVARLPWCNFGKAVNFLLFPIIVVVGRVLFSESDSAFLAENDLPGFFGPIST